MPVTPNNPRVTITPPSGTTPASVSPTLVSPVGANATITFSFVAGTTGWTITAFSIKTTSIQPPSGMFSNTTPYGKSTLVIQDKNGDSKLYSYNLTITNGTTTVTIDPDIQNDAAAARP